MPSQVAPDDRLIADGSVQTPSRNMLEKALQLLKALGSSPTGGEQAAELARSCEVPLSTAYRLLGDLVDHGFVEIDRQTKRYSLGLEIYALSQSLAQSRGLTGVARPILESLARATGEAALLSARDGGRQIYVHYVPGPHLVSVVGRPGTVGPLHCTAMGKILVAMAPEPVRIELTETVDLSHFGPNCITDRDAFRREIRKVRDQGWASADEEHEAGIRAVAVPVLDPDGRGARLAISVAGPSLRVEVTQMYEWLPQLRDAAREIALTMPRE